MSSEIYSSFLSPNNNYNVLVVTGPIGCGKTTKVKEELTLRQDVNYEYFYDDIDNLKPIPVGLDGKMSIIIIDPADEMDIPKSILRYPCKFILVAESVDTLPSWCDNKDNVRYLKYDYPTNNELLTVLQKTNPSISVLPSTIHSFYDCIFYNFDKGFSYQEKDSSTGSMKPIEFIEAMRNGQNVNPNSNLFKNYPWILDTFLNKLIADPNGIETIAELDCMKHTGLKDTHLITVSSYLIRTTSKLIEYRGVFVKKNKPTEKPKEDEKIEKGKVTKKMIQEREQIEQKTKVKNLFDFA